MKKIYSLAKKLGVKVEVTPYEITVIGDDNRIWVNTETHDLFVAFDMFDSRAEAYQALLDDMSCGLQPA